jgi:hypothetical protein
MLVPDLTNVSGRAGRCRLIWLNRLDGVINFGYCNGNGANSLFAAACGMMEKEHGGACADLVGHATRGILRPVSCSLSAALTGRDYSTQRISTCRSARTASAKPARARFWGRLTYGSDGQGSLPGFQHRQFSASVAETVALLKSFEIPNNCSASARNWSTPNLISMSSSSFLSI